MLKNRQPIFLLIPKKVFRMSSNLKYFFLVLFTSILFNFYQLENEIEWNKYIIKNETLYASFKNIKSLAGIENYPYLLKISLNVNKINTLKYLDKVKQVKSLDLSSNKLINITLVGCLISLIRLLV